MQILKESSLDEMIATFLTADFYSSESKAECVKGMLDSLGVTEDVLYCRLDDKSEYTEPPKLRRAILDRCHGLTIKGLNLDAIKWYWAKPEQNDVLSLMNYEDFINWTGGTLDPHDAIEGLATARPLEAMAEAIRSGESMAPCICVTTGLAGKSVFLDGNGRAIAFSYLDRPIEEIILGISPTITTWNFYPPLAS